MPGNPNLKFDRTTLSKPLILTTAGSSTVNGWWGVTQISSAASQLHFIKAGAVQAGSLIFTQLAHLAGTAQTSGMPPLVVGSIIAGSGFILTPACSWALLNSYSVYWMVSVRS